MKKQIKEENFMPDEKPWLQQDGNVWHESTAGPDGRARNASGALLMANAGIDGHILTP